MRVCGAAIGNAEDALEVGEAVVAAEAGVVAEEQQHERVGHRLRDDREIHALDARAEGEEAEHEGEQAGHQDHEQRGEPEVVGEAPVPGIGLPVEEHHEVRQVALVHAVVADRAHQVHAHRVAAEREEHAVAERQDAGVAPDQVHRQRDDGVAHDLADQRDGVVATGGARCPAGTTQVAAPATSTRRRSARRRRSTPSPWPAAGARSAVRVDDHRRSGRRAALSMPSSQRR